MKAIVIDRTGGPEVLTLKEIPTPTPKSGEVLVRVRAFGINQSEILTRSGASPRLRARLPRVLGIECVGEAVAAPGGEVTEGQTVAALVGGMGRDYDGGYAQYACVPAAQVIPLSTILDWPTLGAIPEMFMTAWVAIDHAMRDAPNDAFLVRGGSSSVGLAAIALGRDRGLTVAATTRTRAKAAVLSEIGAHHVIVDDGAVAPGVREMFPTGAGRVLELIGPATLLDSLAATAPFGVVAVVGNLGKAAGVDGFSPMAAIPYCARLTVANTTQVNRASAGQALQDIVTKVESGRIRLRIDRSFALHEIADAQRYMESGKACGKLVVVL